MADNSFSIPGCRSIFGLVFAVGLGFLSTQSALGENQQSGKAVDGELRQRFTEAELVAQVQIAGIHRDVDNALSEPGMTAVLGYVYSAVSRQVWKGQANRLIAFRLGLDACDRKLEKGGTYLIFASPDSYGRLQLRNCEAAVPEAEAGALLAQLKEYAKPG
ncbi:hypothetical protein [Microbulbifer litoralis]|uniref:hypothetical protein n=1 Tax=Microbulbifer litoralis TaxID=2933965 RepID=UPI0020278170|nr:hypothetical protein [Microbulbifer sp. GX H0434]